MVGDGECLHPELGGALAESVGPATPVEQAGPYGRGGGRTRYLYRASARSAWERVRARQDEVFTGGFLTSGAVSRPMGGWCRALGRCRGLLFRRCGARRGRGVRAELGKKYAVLRGDHSVFVGVEEECGVSLR